MIKPNAFPPFATPPGDTLLETINALNMSQIELESRTGINKKTINRIIKGKEPITQKTALALEKVLKVPAQFWLNMDNRYRQQLAREKETQTMSAHADWVKRFPYAEMVKARFVEAAATTGEKAARLLQFFAVSQPEAWEETYQGMAGELSYRKMTRAGDKFGALSAWLRRGEIMADAVEAPPFDEAAFLQALETIRTLTTKEPKEFLPKMQELCTKAGVIYLLVPELPGLGICGVMRWYRGRPVIQQTLLFKTNDHFWFTFFHEARHVLQKRKKDVFLEGIAAAHEDPAREEDANNFSGELLIPEKEWKRFTSAAEAPVSATIRSFAERIEIHPGIVVGRLMKEKILAYSHPARHLQVKFQWA